MKQVALRLDDELAAAIDKARGEVPRERWIRERAADAALDIDLGPDFPLSEVARRRREEIQMWLLNALTGVRCDPVGGNVTHCIERALDAARDEPSQDRMDADTHARVTADMVWSSHDVASRQAKLNAAKTARAGKR
jgi:hypothetical protein